jgi:hypothetical protein
MTRSYPNKTMLLIPKKRTIELNVLVEVLARKELAKLEKTIIPTEY